jgi:hypothetical protein
MAAYGRAKTRKPRIVCTIRGFVRIVLLRLTTKRRADR